MIASRAVQILNIVGDIVCAAAARPTLANVVHFVICLYTIPHTNTTLEIDFRPRGLMRAANMRNHQPVQQFYRENLCCDVGTRCVNCAFDTHFKRLLFVLCNASNERFR